MVEYLEFFGMVFSMLGAFFSSRKSNSNKYILYGFISFLIADIAMFYMALFLGMIPLLTQVIFFTLSAITGISKIKNNILITKLLYILFALMLVSSIYIIGLNKEDLTFDISLIEVIAATLAIIGSFMLAYKEYRMYSFILFFIADIIYIYVAYEKELLFFGIQSAFFIYTSYAGYKNNKK